MASVQNESKRAGANANASSSTRERHTSNVTSSNSNSNNATANANANSSNRYRSSPTPSQKSSSRYRNSPTQNAAKEKGSHNHNRTKSSSEKSTTSRSRPQLQPQSQSQPSQSQSPANNAPKEDQAIVTPELLVDALSGHEDGLLAIAERLMEHYDTGYDAMGEAIIDAFADVQKLFQHVVEAAHMEGAAYEAGRKEEEIEKLKRALGGEGGGHLNGEFENDHGHRHGHDGNGNGNGGLQNGGGSPPLRHEEFIDQDVRDVLSEAIRKGQGMKDSNKYADCFQIYEFACNNASSLLPVDSDHRGRLQLSIARAESMSPERACAILRYVMDDVLRSGLNSNSKVVMPDPSQRGDCVLSRPEGAGTISGRFTAGQGVSADDSGVLQSSEEALASLVEEMKEILSAPVYDNSPLQNVAQRFWAALSDAQRSNLKNEETLEQKLAILKAEFLLAREEWEDKYNVLSHKCNNYKKNVDTLKHQKYMDQARGNLPSLGNEYIGDSDDDGFLDPEAPTKLDSPRPTHVSGSSSFVSLSQQAKSIASSFGCSGNRRNKTSSNRDSSPPSAASTWASRKTMSSGRG